MPLRWVRVLMMVPAALACGSGAPGGAPVPASLKVTLQYGRKPSVLHYEIRQTCDVERPAKGQCEEEVVRLTETVTDSEGEHHVTGMADSIISTSMSVRLPLTHFYGWFDDHRHFLDTLMNTLGGEWYGRLAFAPLVPLPDGRVGVGGSWKFDASGPYRISLPLLGPLSAGGEAKIRRLEVVNGDTVATIGLHLRVQRHDPKDDIRGDLSGEELFSVSRGVTIRVKLSGRIGQFLSVDTPIGVKDLEVPFQASIEQTLLP